MNRRKTKFWSFSGLCAACSGLVFQQGCNFDPDLVLQAAVQILTETAIFFTDNAVRGLI